MLPDTTSPVRTRTNVNNHHHRLSTAVIVRDSAFNQCVHAYLLLVSHFHDHLTTLQTATELLLPRASLPSIATIASTTSPRTLATRFCHTSTSFVNARSHTPICTFTRARFDLLFANESTNCSTRVALRAQVQELREHSARANVRTSC